MVRAKIIKVNEENKRALFTEEYYEQIKDKEFYLIDVATIYGCNMFSLVDKSIMHSRKEIGFITGEYNIHWTDCDDIKDGIREGVEYLIKQEFQTKYFN
jgi:hypothetical protein